MHLRLARFSVLTTLIAAALGCSESVAADRCEISTPPRLVQLAPAGDVSQEKRLGRKGTTTIEVLVDLFEGGGGYLAEARIAESSGTPSLDRAAMYAARYSTYAPGTCDGKPVPGKVLVKVALP